MTRKQASRLARSASTLELRRSARLQPQQPEPPTTENQEIKQDPPPRSSTRTQNDNKNDPTEEKENAPERQGRAPVRRKLQVSKAKSLSRTRSSSSSGQKDTPMTKTDTVLEASTPVSVIAHATVNHKKNKAVDPPSAPNKKRRVCFAERADPEPFDRMVDHVARAKAAAASVRLEDLVAKADRYKNQYDDIEHVPCPPRAERAIRPWIKLGRDRRKYGEAERRKFYQYPPMFVLAFAFDAMELSHHLKRVDWGRYRKCSRYDVMDRLIRRLWNALWMQREKDIVEWVTADRKPGWILIVSKSSRPETLPYPEERVRKIQETIGTKIPPTIMPLQLVGRRERYGCEPRLRAEEY
ncbi:hypothetical protein K525DRAFT_257339 [Schizophyllum commune Loenen D]|nr:hypothetical protein K525DRAFT_257339 [Schizophyllum commune Loenen D]